MDDEVMLSWNVTNWITVVLMVAIGFAVLTLIGQGVRKIMQNKANRDA